MDEPIPFTTGPLKNWPLVEEALSRRFDEFGIEPDDELRAEAMADVRRLYEALAAALSGVDQPPALTMHGLSEHQATEARLAAQRWWNDLQAWAGDQLLARVFGHFTGSSISAARRRRDEQN